MRADIPILNYELGISREQVVVSLTTLRVNRTSLKGNSLSLFFLLFSPARDIHLSTDLISSKNLKG